jgi:hypothetical protein
VLVAGLTIVPRLAYDPGMSEIRTRIEALQRRVYEITVRL